MMIGWWYDDNDGHRDRGDICDNDDDTDDNYDGDDNDDNDDNMMMLW